MAIDATQVRVGISGQVYKAPLGTTKPSDSTTALESGYQGLGYISDDGVTENWDDSVDNIVAWQNATTVRSSTTESTGTLAMTFIQTNRAVLEAFHRGSVVESNGDGEFMMNVKPVEADPSVWVLDVMDGDKHIRIYIGNGEVTERGEIMYQNGEPIGFPLTITAYPDADGNVMTKFSNDAAWDPAS